MASLARVRVSLFLSVLAMTLAWKIVTVERGFAVDQASVAAERQHILLWLHRHGFETSIPPDNGIATVAARRGECRMTLVSVDPRGFHRELLNTMRPPEAHLFFVYKGELYPRQPVMRTLIAQHLWARSRDLGIRVPRYIVLGVLTAGCTDERLPWSDVGRID